MLSCMNVKLFFLNELYINSVSISICDIIKIMTRKNIKDRKNTPYFLFDINKIKKNINRYENRNFILNYSVKSCLFDSLVKETEHLLDGFTVSSKRDLEKVRIETQKPIHFVSPLIRDSEIKIVNSMGNSITFNSLNQFYLFEESLSSHIKTLIRINPEKSFLKGFFIVFLSLFYLPSAHSNTKDPDTSQECLRAFSSQTTESEGNMNSLLDQIKNASRNQAMEILKEKSPENLKLLTKELFSRKGRNKEKYNLLYTLRENPPEDPDIQWVLAKALQSEEESVMREVIQTVGKINKYIKPEVLSEIIKILMRTIRFGESNKIKQAAAKALSEINKDPKIHWDFIDIISSEEDARTKQALIRALGRMQPEDPDIHLRLKNMISSEEDDRTKQALIHALGEMNSKDPEIHQFLAKMLSEKKELETEQDIWAKREVARAIAKMKDIKDPKTLRLLAEGLDSLNGEEQLDIRKDIYSSLETASKHIPVKTGRKLARRMVRKNHSSEDKRRIIEIVTQMKPKDTLTIQWLAEGLDDPDSNVRRATAKALEDILEVEPNFLKRVGYDEGIYPLFVRPIKNWVSTYDLAKDIRFSIIRELIDAASFDPDPSVRKAAIEAIVKINTGFAMGIDILIEALSFDSDSDVKVAANKGLIEIFDRSLFLNAVFYLTSLLPSKNFEIRKKSKIIEQLANHLYNKDQELRRIARQALDKITKPKKYYSVQKKKADDLKDKITKYDTKGIKTRYDNPNSQPPNKVPPPFESWFEVEVFLEIHERGFVVLPQAMAYGNSETPAKDYRIDLLVLDANDSNKKLAVECDGPRHEDPTRKISDLERQIALGEQGLAVSRIKNTDFYSFPSGSNPDYDSLSSNWKNRRKRTESLDSLWRKLKELGIKPAQSTKTGYFQE